MNARNFRPIENAPAARGVGIVPTPGPTAKTMILLAPWAVAEQFLPHEPLRNGLSARPADQRQPVGIPTRLYFPQ